MLRSFCLPVVAAVLVSLPAQAQPSSAAAAEGTSVRNCRTPAGAKQAQVLAFDKTTLEAKLAVVMDDSNFKIVTLKVWDRTKDPRPVVPVIEAARITQGKLQFYTPNLEVDPEPVHDKEFVVVAALGGSQVCWTTDPGMLKDSGAQPRSAEAGPGATGETGRRR